LKVIDINTQFLHGQSIFVRFIRKLFTLLGRVICTTVIKIRPSQVNHLAGDENFIVCPNHCSHLDNIAIIYGSGFPPDRFVFMAAKDYFFKNKFLRRIYSALFNIIPFDRSNDPKALVTNLTYLRKCINANKIVVLYPEGTRSIDGHLQKFKLGIALIASELNIAVVPTYLEGTHHCLPKGSWLIRPGKINIVFGKKLNYLQVVEPQSVKYHEYIQFVNRIKAEIISFMETKA